ncbi:hypothetical protein ACFVSN_43210 [Kitasatospora sp. NPDC057904]|uniref:hypothetical protein n=1 Tax=unclassified Kitasatospora TaxID=2633591 RepID=UPI0036DC0F12
MERELFAQCAPLDGRVGHVGGIESLTLDGRRYYFGFDYRSDLVLSPLFDDAGAMAAFASAHMRQTSGRHDEAHWAGLVAAAAGHTELGCDDAQRDVVSARLGGALPEAGGYLLYLLGAVTGWDDWFGAAPPEVQEALDGLGFAGGDDGGDDDELAELVDDCLEAVREFGAQARPDEWAVVRFHLTAAIRHLPGTWGLVFAPLAQGVLAQGVLAQEADGSR